MRNDGREFERYLKWFKDLETQTAKTAITSSSGGSSHRVARTQWDKWFEEFESKKGGKKDGR